MNQSKILILILLAGAELSSTAQSHELNLELVGGASKLLTNYLPEDGTFKNCFAISESFHTNYYYNLDSSSAFGIGILFSDIRGKEITNRSELTSSGNTKTSANTIRKSYWFCGVDLRYRISIHKFQLEIGGYYSVMLRKRATATGHSLDGTNAVDWEYDVEQTTSYQDAGFTVATTYPVTRHLSIGIQYTQGLINIASVHTEFPNYSYPWKNYTTQIGLKCTFKILKF